MPWKEKWEHFKESILHHEQEVKRRKEEERRVKARDHALHHSDLSSGSETLDDGIGRD
jgi:hypothetical protein